jgi:hypothetical protein
MMETVRRSRNRATALLLFGIVMLQLLPVMSFLHEVAEHDALEISHCACLVCHTSLNTPAAAGAGALHVANSENELLVRSGESRAECVERDRASISERSPPTI